MVINKVLILLHFVILRFAQYDKSATKLTKIAILKERSHWRILSFE